MSNVICWADGNCSSQRHLYLLDFKKPYLCRPSIGIKQSNNFWPNIWPKQFRLLICPLVYRSLSVFWPKYPYFGQNRQILAKINLMLTYSLLLPCTLSIGQKRLLLAKTMAFGQNKVYQPINWYWPKLGFWKVDYLISVFRLKICIGRPPLLRLQHIWTHGRVDAEPSVGDPGPVVPDTRHARFTKSWFALGEGCRFCTSNILGPVT